MAGSGKPLGSNDPIDQFENAKALDLLVNGEEATYSDRFGKERLSIAEINRRSESLRTELGTFAGVLSEDVSWPDIPQNTSPSLGGVGGALNKQAKSLNARVNVLSAQVREALRRSYADAGYTLVPGGFLLGGTLNTSDQVLLDELTGIAYRWSGLLPKKVNPKSTPSNSGGVGPGLWNPVHFDTILELLLEEDGATRIALPVGNVFQAITYVTPEMWDAPCDGINDDAPATKSALDYSVENQIPLIMNGSYLFKTKVSKEVNARVVIAGSGSVTFSVGAFDLTGTVEQEVNITESISTFSATSIKVESTVGFEEDDLGIIHSSVMCLSPDAGSMRLGVATASGSPSWFGEFFEVGSKDATTLNINTPLHFNNYPIDPRPNSGVRTRSTVKRVKPITGVIEGLTFVRKGTGTCVQVKYGKEFDVSRCKVYNNKLPGASVIFAYSYNCEAIKCKCVLHPSTKISFGTVNPGSPAYYSFNFIKCISSQNCGASHCRLENGSQNFDVTYFEHPSVMCYMKGCTVMGPKHNMATSHAGSYATSFLGNIGNGCWRGIAARCREDVVLGNRIIGFRGYPNSPHTNSETYGVGLTEGFTVSAVVRGNVITGFFRIVYVNNDSSRGDGFDYNRIDISDNTFGYCQHHVDVANVIPTDKTIESGITIVGNTMRNNAKESIQFGPYVRAPIVDGNIFLDAPTDDNYLIKTLGNCVGLSVTNNSFKDSAKLLWVQAITDPELGPDTVAGAQIETSGNTVRGNRLSDGFVYGAGTRPSLGNNFEPNILGYKYISVPSTADMTLESESRSVVFLAPQGGAFKIVGITPGINSQELVIFNGSTASGITIKNSTTVQTRSGVDEVVLLATPMRLLFVSGKWRQV